VTAAQISSQAYVERARAYQARRVPYLQRGDLDGMLRDLYTEDVRLDTFEFHAEGRTAVKGVIELVMQRTAALGASQVERFVAGRDFIWQEVAIGRAESGIQPYEVKFLRDDRVYLQLYGFREGTLWQPDEFVSQRLPDTKSAQELHDRYVGYHIRGDADGLVDEFFTKDARLVTSNLAVEGREALRSVFRELFAQERDFRSVSVEKITCGNDYVWFEATVTSSLGRRRLYDVQILRDDRVTLQLVGLLGGTLPTEAARIER
jgi:hypothetical protein